MDEQTDVRTDGKANEGMEGWKRRKGQVNGQKEDG